MGKAHKAVLDIGATAVNAEGRQMLTNSEPAAESPTTHATGNVVPLGAQFHRARNGRHQHLRCLVYRQYNADRIVALRRGSYGWCQEPTLI